MAEDFYTVQGEGYHTGKPAYFIRLGGCDVGCRWCDAKFTWRAGMFPLTDVDELVARAIKEPARAFVITGGEPTLYPLDYLTESLKSKGVEIFLETSGAYTLTGTFDWICLSPKRQKPPMDEIWSKAHELKVIVESEEDIAWAEACAAKVGEGCMLFLQPEWSRFDSMMPMIVDYVKANPSWNISIQSHKFMRIP